MDIKYTLETLTSAVRILAIHPGEIKKRLKLAVTDNFLILSEGDIPSQTLNEFSSIAKRLRKVDEAQNIFGASIDAMSEKEAIDLAENIVDLRNKIEAIWRKN